jgi:DNA polymerase III subunit epsilon
MSNMQDRNTFEEMAAALEASGHYKILRRVVPRPMSTGPVNPTDKVGVVLDVETTGLDHTRDEVVELGMVRFSYSEADEITSVTGTFQVFREPSVPISPEVTDLTGITNDMVAGQRIDEAAVEAFVRDANVVIAHNAGFDRKFAERSWPVFAHRHWACSFAEIDWRKHGFAGANLGYLLSGCGLFHAAHRAVDDCHAVLEILAKPLPGASETALAALLTRARQPSVRVWAEHSPFDLKDVLKARGYKWSDGSDGSPRCWYVDVAEDRHPAEIEFLRSEIYQRRADVRSQTLTALERFSTRI